MNSLSLLHHNFAAIWSCEQNNTHLIADENYLYDSSTLQGIYVSIKSRFYGASEVTGAVRKTKEIFDQFVTLFETRCTHYPIGLRPLLVFDQQTRPFRKMASQDVRFRQFHSTSLNTIICAYRRALKLELALGKPLPVDLLTRAFKEEKLGYEEEEALYYWFKESIQKTNIHLFHRGVSGLLWQGNGSDPVNFVQKIGSVYLSLSRCLPEHLSYFYSIDAKVKRFASGAFVHYNNKVVQIDRQIGARVCCNDKNLVFSLNDPNKVLIVLQNEAKFGILAASKLKEWGIKGPKIHWIDPHGQYAIVERLYAAPFNDIKEPFIRWVQWLMTKNGSPIGLRGRHLMFSKGGELRSTMPGWFAPFNPIDLEEAAFNLSKGNLNHFRYLMNKSGLAKHCWTKRVQKHLKDTLIAQELLPLEWMKKEECFCNKSMARCLEGQKRLLALYRELNTLFPSDPNKNKEVLIKSYSETKAGYIIWPTLKQMAIQKLNEHTASAASSGDLVSSVGIK